MSRKAKKYFGYDMYIGLYFLNIWLDLMGETDIQQAMQALNDNPLKGMPKLIQAGVNSYNEIEGKDERISFFEACEIVEDKGINSPDFQNIIKDLSASLKIDNPEKKNKPKAVKPRK